ncbi:PhaM family polyhydroxyalkanoate granule multifunctional regulatory protein [Tepidicella baoligensis]|uniref:PhaM family polyhydroxyalkanoate granule multifunctional regulatory protein n=1 Tax=Tepidicella baoligensis TaxID=2707016 RepID=UPI0015DAF78B|nr:PhaM family polyhydroxyalkanoate granule multifunctional regulatory protein [Tepidicella baoligensis]
MTAPDMHAFAKYIPGFEFLQNLSRQTAAGAAPGQAGAAPGMPPMSHWVAPTLDVEELDKRIQDLRAVHFWLDQNTKALAATIQALEVQKMTLAALKGMNVSLQDMAEAFQIRPEPTADAAAATAATAAPTPAAPPSEAAAANAAPALDPLQWWNALTHQFQTIANGAIRDMAEHASRAAEQMTQTVQAGTEPAAAAQASPADLPPPTRSRATKRPRPAPRQTTGASRPAAKKAPAAATRKKASTARKG